MSQYTVITEGFGSFGNVNLVVTEGFLSATKVDYTLACATGVYTYAGGAATLTRGIGLACATGVSAYAGGAATLTIGRGLVCSTGAYNYAGGTATLTYVSGAVVATPETPSGGYFDYGVKRRKTAAQIKRERIKLGIIPPEVERLVRKVAEKAITKATEGQQNDILEWAIQEAQKELYERQIRNALSRSNLEWDRIYQKLFEISIMEALQDEEDIILLLMMEI